MKISVPIDLQIEAETEVDMETIRRAIAEAVVDPESGKKEVGELLHAVYHALLALEETHFQLLDSDSQSKTAMLLQERLDEIHQWASGSDYYDFITVSHQDMRQITCDRCRSSFTVPDGTDIPMFLAIMRQFAITHRGCKEQP